MDVHSMKCQRGGCSRRFTSKSRSAKWCSPACKRAVERERAAGRAAGVRPAEVLEHDLVVVVRAELVKHSVAETVDGKLAVHLALAVAAAESSGKVGPVAQLRSVLATATNRALPEDAEPGDSPVDDVPDEVDEIQQRRDERARAAAG